MLFVYYYSSSVVREHMVAYSEILIIMITPSQRILINKNNQL